jgi:DNA-binding transcriptional MerR regulator
MGELSRRAGVPVPTIKYYLREGLLAPGERTSPNQMRYNDRHVRRLRLIRALIDIGGLSVAATRTVLTQIDTPDRPLHDVLGKAQYALTRQRDHTDDRDATAVTRDEVARLISRRGWRVRPTNPAVATLTGLLATLHDLGQDDIVALLDDFADAADRLAAAEIDLISRRTDVEAMIEGVVVGTALGDAMLAAVRRLAQENASSRYFTADADRPRAPRKPPPDGQHAKSAGST